MRAVGQFEVHRSAVGEFLASKETGPKQFAHFIVKDHPVLPEIRRNERNARAGTFEKLFVKLSGVKPL